MNDPPKSAASTELDIAKTTGPMGRGSQAKIAAGAGAPNNVTGGRTFA